MNFNCACLFTRDDEFSEATLVEPCGYHARMAEKIERLQAENAKLMLTPCKFHAGGVCAISQENQRLQADKAKLREAGECALYALEHPESDQMFAIRALHEALAE